MARQGLTVALADPAAWAAGVTVALDAQEANGLPDPDALPPWNLARRVAARQEASVGVWLARQDGLTVGHALIQPVARDHADWSTMDAPALRRALSRKDWSNSAD